MRNKELHFIGIVPPDRPPADYFDAGSKSHVIGDTPYIRYFFSFISQFQFYKAMCKAANQTGDLYTCDFYQSKAAGDLLSNMLKMGNSKPWTEAMQLMTGISNSHIFSWHCVILLEANFRAAQS